jgi:hypothetical protein
LPWSREEKKLASSKLGTIYKPAGQNLFKEDARWRRRGGGLTRRLVHGGGDQRWGKDVGKPEQGSPAGSERLGREYLVARCLGWGRGDRRGVRAGCLLWLSDSKHGGVWGDTGAVKRRRRKKRGCSFYSCERRWNEGGAVVKPWVAKWWWWPRSGCRRCGLGADVRTVRLTIGPHVVSHFSELSKLAETYKVKKAALSFSKNFQFLNEASLEYSEQLFQLCQLQIPHRDRVKNPGTDSIFESLMNFKRD